MTTTLVRTITTARAHMWGPSRSRLPARLRLLPILIFVASLFLTVKVGLIWRDTGFWLGNGAIAISGAQAKSESAASTKPAPGTPEAHAASSDTAAPDAAAPAKDHGRSGGAGPAGKLSASQPAPAEAKEPGFSSAEVEVLRQLAERHATLNARARELDKRDAVLSAAERRLDAKAQALPDLQTKVTALLKKHEDEQDAKMASLAKLYESMKPKEAAAILQTLELGTLLRVAERMNERKLAPIMAKMNPARARDMTMELVRLRAIDPRGAVRSPTPRPGRDQ